MFTLATCTIFNGYTQVNIKILLIQTNHTTCVSFSCQFIWTDIVENASVIPQYMVIVENACAILRELPARWLCRDKVKLSAKTFGQLLSISNNT